MKTLTVLLVDDDRDDRELFCETIQEIDDNILCISKPGGIEALDYLKQKKNGLPDYIFLDLNMPAMDGKECLVRIRKLSYLDQIPIIIYSTSKNPVDADIALKLGASFFLTKQGHLNELKDDLRRILLNLL